MCRRKSTYVTAILIPLAVGGLSALLSRNGMAAYQTLEKPPLVLTAKMVKSFYKKNKKAAYLQIPYLLWLLFAAYLNFGVWMLNR